MTYSSHEMNLLDRVASIRERARVRDGWITEDVAASVLAEIERSPAKLMLTLISQISFISPRNT